MKQILITVVLISITIINLRSQNLELGIKTGFGFSTIRITNLPGSEDNSDIFSPIASYSLNGTLGYKSNGFWGFSFEPGFIKKGWILDKGNSDKISLQYLQIPILSDFYVSDRLYFSIGPELNILIKAKNKSVGSTQDITDYSNKLELSGLVGATYKILDNLDIGIRYSHGLTQISDNVFWAVDEFDENQKELKDYNQNLQFIIKLSLKTLR